MKSIFSYIDYRKYIAEYFVVMKKTQESFSYRYFSLKAGIASPSFVKMVIDGKRNIGNKFIENFAKGLKLNKKESEFFRHLVLFDQATTVADKHEQYRKIRALKESLQIKNISYEQSDYFATWYNPVVRELITIYDFQDDFEKIARSICPPIKTNQARGSVNLLLRLKLVEKQADGTYIQKDLSVINNEKEDLMAIRHFNREMHQLSFRAMDEFPINKRNVSGMTVGISSAMYDVICEEISSFKERIADLVSMDHDSNSVYQMNIQLFPLSCENDEVIDFDKSREKVR